VVLVARGDAGGVERTHRGVLAGGEREVHVLGERPPVVEERERAVRAGELDPLTWVVARIAGSVP
jgi:hypothetical protein